jgi:2-amino-4-hydroxy-6-hydroxymethyldihydropteridine diphosphokinase
MSAAPQRAYVGLGANLGDARATLRDALQRIAALPQTQLVRVSSFYRSAPVDAGGPDFVNAVAELSTELEPVALLRALQAIELDHGRERPYRNAPRTLDLDLLLHGDTVVPDPVLTLPHPRGHERAFVLRPLAEIAPDLLWPGHGPVAALAAAITDQPIEKLPPLP